MVKLKNPKYKDLGNSKREKADYPQRRSKGPTTDFSTPTVKTRRKQKPLELKRESERVRAHARLNFNWSSLVRARDFRHVCRGPVLAGDSTSVFSGNISKRASAGGLAEAGDTSYAFAKTRAGGLTETHPACLQSPALTRRFAGTRPVCLGLGSQLVYVTGPGTCPTFHRARPSTELCVP